jgi:competence protein ComEA
MPITDLLGLNLLRNSQIKALATSAFLFGGVVFSLLVFGFWEIGQKQKEAIQIIKAPEAGNVLGGTAPVGQEDLSILTRVEHLDKKETLINLNTATAQQLETLPGIGPSFASRIIEYRQTTGFFMTKEEVMRVKGIGKRTYERFKDLICVK